MSSKPQTYANHRRFFPLFHLFVSPVLAANLVIKVMDAWKDWSAGTAWGAVVAAALVALAVSARLMALTVQNRLIRLEERLRLATILPEDLRARVPELRAGQLIALRFASDAETPGLVRRCLEGEFANPGEIKRAIKDWRRDTLRV